MGMTLAEKILARASGRGSVKAGDYVTADIDLAMIHEGMRGVYPILKEAGVKKLWDPEKVVNLMDHWVPAPTVQAAVHHQTIRRAAVEYGIRYYYGENAGICHQVLPEKGHVVPGDLIVGTDSHTVTYGAFGAAGTGIGYSEMAYVLATGKLWFRVPETLQFRMEGKLSRGVMSKDLLLYIAGRYSAEVAQYKAVEFTGTGGSGYEPLRPDDDEQHVRGTGSQVRVLRAGQKGCRVPGRAGEENVCSGQRPMGMPLTRRSSGWTRLPSSHRSPFPRASIG